jgi:hypothetical protein
MLRKRHTWQAAFDAKFKYYSYRYIANSTTLKTFDCVILRFRHALIGSGFSSYTGVSVAA